MTLLFKDFSAITWDAVLKEQLKVAPDRNQLIHSYSNIDLAGFRQQGRFFVQPRRYEKFTSLSNATTIWVPGGDHEYLYGNLFPIARFYAGNMPYSLSRYSGEPECAHGLGAADLSVNYAHIKFEDIRFDDLFSTKFYKSTAFLNRINLDNPNLAIIKNNLPELVAVTQYLHDILENYKDAILKKNWKLSASHVIGSIFHDKIDAPGIPEAARFASYYLHLMTDSPELSGDARHQEQIDRGNNDKSAILTRNRIYEKANAALSDRFAMLHKKMPFLSLREEDLLTDPKTVILKKLDKAFAKYTDYTNKRLHTATKLIDHGNLPTQKAKAGYIKLTLGNQDIAETLYGELKINPLLLLHRPSYYGAPCDLPQPK